MYALTWSPWLLVAALLLLSGRSAALKMYLYDLPSSLVKPPCQVQHNYHLEEALPRFLAMSPTSTSDGSNADFFVVPATPYCRQTEADMEVRVHSVALAAHTFVRSPNPKFPFARAPPGVHTGGAAEAAGAAVVAAARRR
jgi:hypothetical protein